MARFAATFPFTLGDDPDDVVVAVGCWNPALAPPVPIEQKLLLPLPSPALELLRAHLLQAATQTRDAVKGARTVVQLAFETELRVYLNEVVEVPPAVLEARVCERRRYIEIDGDMRRMAYLYERGLAEAVPAVFSRAYAEGVQAKLLAGKDARTRMGALAVLLCSAAARLV